MKYLVGTKAFDTIEDAQKEEEKLELEKKEKEEKNAQRKERAEEVQNALKNYMDTQKRCCKEIDDAYKQYLELRNKFIADYGSFHISYTNNNGEETFNLTDLFDGTQRFIKDFFGF